MALSLRNRLKPHSPRPVRRFACRVSRSAFFRPSIEILECRQLLSLFTVTNIDDSGPGSLRQAILDSNADQGATTVAFNIGWGGVQTISPTSALPTITHPVVVDGTTQPGFPGAPLIVLNGGSAGANTSGLMITAGSSTVRGLVIDAFSGDGIVLRGRSGNLIAANYIGTDATGSAALGNGYGVWIDSSSDNTIGGTTAGARNILSGNRLDGIRISGQQAANNLVQANYIGTDVSGTSGLGNNNGVSISSAANNVIGGTRPEARNIVSGNSRGCGVSIVGSGSTASRFNMVVGNYIGTDVTGATALSNGCGVEIVGANNLIGGPTPGAGNLISGNRDEGICIDGAMDTISHENLVQGNFIGTNATGTVALGNADGVSIANGIRNKIGGTTLATRNIISGNREDGVYISRRGRFGAAYANLVQGNYIGTDVTGTRALGNDGDGVYIGASEDNEVGGIMASAANIISGNREDGVFITQNGTGQLVQGNYIGTDATGRAALNNRNGVVIEGSENLIGGTTPGARNVISGNTVSGITISSASNFVEGNYIGTDVTGTEALGNSLYGVYVRTSNNVIGGTTPGARNLISGNFAGVVLAGTDNHDNQVRGNYIGTDVTGTIALGNEFGVEIGQFGVARADRNMIGGATAGAGNLISGNGRGVVIDSGRNNVVQGNYIGTDATGTAALGNGVGLEIGDSNNTVGGATAGAGNFISGNASDGIRIEASNTQVQGNYIGTDVTGTSALANGLHGVNLLGQSFLSGNDNTIGGTTPGTGNLISGNQVDGIHISLETTSDSRNRVQGNYIGTDITGTRPLGNGRHGVYLLAQNSVIGRSVDGAGNTIAFNGGDGVLVDRGTRNVIRGNSIFSHIDGLGIRLTNGANNNQASAVLTSATSEGGNTTVEGKLTSAPSTAFALEFFANRVCNPSGFGEGEQFLGSTMVTTEADGTASFDVAFAVDVPPGEFITATATDPNGNTSQFSACMEVREPTFPGWIGGSERMQPCRAPLPASVPRPGSLPEGLPIMRPAPELRNPTVPNSRPVAVPTLRQHQADILFSRPGPDWAEDREDSLFPLMRTPMGDRAGN